MRILLCTDLDRTLLPNGPAPESPAARPRFCALAGHEEVTLAYVTGRHRELVEAAIAEYDLPAPDFVIGDVGTSLYRVTGSDWKGSVAWSTRIARDWAGLSRDGLAELLVDIPGLRLQEPAKQGAFKLSWYALPDWDQARWLPEMEQRLADAGVRPSLIWSVDETSGTGLLDLLPASATKRHAVEFLMGQEGFAATHTLCAGDSGNDIAMLASPLPAVLVANATATVRADAIAAAEQAGTLDSLYLARGDFHGMNGNYSAGILEGLAHFLPETVASWEAIDHDGGGT
ncbi:HAD-superfamily hydrolase, subfamily IIB [Thioflavicoccus mobilis 8321]|uniref:HAD-superfamily hydrolase, subfamily IIB n=1 Tax=Thioflavicoccus mobilis 8321 TaxID=765912 RepID=L0GT35_9GAMM|nr:HAD-IIB family hydrolase [Thioflavicoccus mobilis]AGA89933.1 HAD-superfamily hydrolase, subfamily IIB [Thioflavicoccus mobilis 8321]